MDILILLLMLVQILAAVKPALINALIDQCSSMFGLFGQWLTTPFSHILRSARWRTIFKKRKNWPKKKGSDDSPQ